jgi:hypothetical protein
VDAAAQIRDALALIRASVNDPSTYGVVLGAMDETEARLMVNALVILAQVDRDPHELVAWCEAMMAKFENLPTEDD